MDPTFSDSIALLALIVSIIGAAGGAYAWRSDRKSQSWQRQEEQSQRREDDAEADRKEAQRRSEVADWAMKAMALLRGAVCRLKDQYEGALERALMM